MNSLFIGAYIFLLLFLLVFLPIRIYQRKKAGKVKIRTTYSIKSVGYDFIKSLPSFFAIVCLIFLLSKDVDVTLSLGVLIFGCYLAGSLKILLYEYQRKRAGGKEKRWDKDKG